MTIKEEFHNVTKSQRRELEERTREGGKEGRLKRVQSSGKDRMI